MYLYLLTQESNKTPGCVVACIVVATDEEMARYIHPDTSITWMHYNNCWGKTMFDHTIPHEDTLWAHPYNVEVEFVGEASDHLQQPGVLMATRSST